MLNKCICRSFIHSYYLRGAVSPKPGAADYVPPCKRIISKLWNQGSDQQVVESGLITTDPTHLLSLLDSFPTSNGTWPTSLV
jgi:hypothetical protein